MSLDLILKKQGLGLNSIVYSFILALFFLMIFLFIDYNKMRKTYKVLDDIVNKDIGLQSIFKVPEGVNYEHELFRKSLIKSYQTYKNILEKYSDNQKKHIYFINQWVHQMKTPVSVINLILQEDIDKNEVKKVFESTQEEVDKISYGLEMALYTSRINDFEIDFKVEEFDILHTVRSVVNENKKIFIKNRIYPKIECKENIKVNTDAKWIKFVINQIVINAIKYSKAKDRDNKTVSIGILRKEDKVTLSIKDEGVGITKEDIKRVFDPFFTGVNGRKHSESTGMGLYLSKTVCDKLGHEISVKSEEGIGTTVTIIFYSGKSICNIVK